MPGLKHRENHSGTKSHYLLLTHLESVISYTLFCYFTSERSSSLKKKKQSEKQIVHQRGIIFPGDSSGSRATSIKGN